ncbi:hypothetical protein Sviol_48540 [Streptomyces violascens]|uniref:Uncharacterized protein n=1 Tax=Streptomyces violascens TaxID=67381 RepID=A0ABQ3QT29_9ACTN|nr:hypothetical protein Sviol_48540 [Streptomyces violascens]
MPSSFASLPTATAGAAVPPDEDGVASAKTVAAAPRTEAPGRGPAPRPVPPGFLAAVVTGVLVVAGGAVYVAAAFNNSRAPFPTAKYKLVPPPRWSGRVQAQGGDDRRTRQETL